MRSPHAWRLRLEGSRWRWAAWLLVLVSLAAMYSESLTAHIRASADPLLFSNDARQFVPALHRYRDRTLFPNDYIVDYYLACLPIGYRWTYAAAATLGVDAEVLSKTLPYGLMTLLLVAVASSAARLGGISAAWAALAGCLSAGVYLAHLTGGLPRAFAFPLVAAIAAALVRGRIVLLAVLAAVGAAFYPVAAVLAGVSLVLVLFILPRSDRGQARDWSVGRRLAAAAMTAVVVAGIVVPIALRSQAYGRLLRPSDEVEYPETGPHGRYARDWPRLSEPLPAELIRYAALSLRRTGRSWWAAAHRWVRADGHPPSGSSRRDRCVWVVLGLTLVGMGCQAVRDPAARRLAVLAVAAVLGALLSQYAIPYLYLPTRYLMYTAPLLVSIAIPVALGTISDLVTPAAMRKWVRPVVVVTGSALCMALLGGKGSADAGLNLRIDSHARIYRYLQSLPADALIAGWPTGVTDNVPYLSRRRALITYETHQTFHHAYANEMRRRLSALFDAYFATTVAPLVRLRDDFGVTHLVVDQEIYRSGPPPYFAPFDRTAQTVYEAGRRRGFETTRQRPHAAAVEEGSHFVLDLGRLALR